MSGRYKPSLAQALSVHLGLLVSQSRELLLGSRGGASLETLSSFLRCFVLLPVYGAVVELLEVVEGLPEGLVWGCSCSSSFLCDGRHGRNILIGGGWRDGWRMLSPPPNIGTSMQIRRLLLKLRNRNRSSPREEERFSRRPLLML